MNITGLSRDELESLLFFCKYSKTYIRTANDYEFLISLLSCYQEYIRIQEMEGVLNQEEKDR